MSKNRIISNDRVRQIRKPKTKILIAVEGKTKLRKTILIILKMVKNHIIFPMLGEPIPIH